jgi:hypothetical protein
LEEATTANRKALVEEDLAVEVVVLENHQGEVLALQLQDLVSKVEVQRLARAVEASVHRHLEASESQAVVQDLARAVEASVHRHLEASESQAVVQDLERVVEASVHRQVDLEVIKDPNQEEVSR